MTLSPKRRLWRDFFETAPLASDDFMVSRRNDLPETRKDVMLGPPKKSFAEILCQIPNVGDDADFERVQDNSDRYCP